MFFFFFKWRLVSGTQQLILLTLFIIRPVSSDQTDLFVSIDDLTFRQKQKKIRVTGTLTLLYRIIRKK